MSKVLDAQVEQALRDKLAILIAFAKRAERIGFNRDRELRDEAIKALKAAGEWAA